MPIPRYLYIYYGFWLLIFFSPSQNQNIQPVYIGIPITFVFSFGALRFESIERKKKETIFVYLQTATLAVKRNTRIKTKETHKWNERKICDYTSYM